MFTLHGKKKRKSYNKIVLPIFAMPNGWINYLDF